MCFCVAVLDIDWHLWLHYGCQSTARSEKVQTKIKLLPGSRETVLTHLTPTKQLQGAYSRKALRWIPSAPPSSASTWVEVPASSGVFCGPLCFGWLRRSNRKEERRGSSAGLSECVYIVRFIVSCVGQTLGLCWRWSCFSGRSTRLCGSALPAPHCSQLTLGKYWTGQLLTHVGSWKYVPIVFAKWWEAAKLLRLETLMHFVA